MSNVNKMLKDHPEMSDIYRNGEDPHKNGGIDGAAWVAVDSPDRICFEESNVFLSRDFLKITGVFG